MTTADISTRPDADLVQQARLWEGAMYGPDDPRGRPAGDYTWQRIEIAIDRITSAPADWREWMNDEIAMWAKDGEPDRYASMLNGPIEEEVCLVQIYGRNYLWDGYHRIGASVMQGKTKIMAIVGTPRFDITNEMIRSIIVADRPANVTQPALQEPEVNKILGYAEAHCGEAVRFSTELDEGIVPIAGGRKASQAAIEMSLIWAFAAYRDVILHFLAALDKPAPGGPEDDGGLINNLDKTVVDDAGTPLIDVAVRNDLEVLKTFTMLTLEPGKWVESPTAQHKAVDACRRLPASMADTVQKVAATFEAMRGSVPPAPNL